MMHSIVGQNMACVRVFHCMQTSKKHHIEDTFHTQNSDSNKMALDIEYYTEQRFSKGAPNRDSVCK